MSVILNEFFSSTSNYQIYEYIYLGKFLHFFIPLIITVLLLKKGIKINQILGIVFFIGLGKELYDLCAINSSVWNSIQDIFLDLSYPLLCMHIISAKKKFEIQNKKKSFTYPLYLKSENIYLNNKG